MNDSIVDSLAFDIPDSLLYRDKRWVVLQTFDGVQYTAAQDTLPDITWLRAGGVPENKQLSFEETNRLILFFVLMLIALLSYAMVHKLTD